jgi:hypothetical protein
MQERDLVLSNACHIQVRLTCEGLGPQLACDASAREEFDEKCEAGAL